MNIGLTGGMGGGKSTAAAIFVELGFKCIDADQQVTEDILRRPAVRAAIRAEFGDAYFESDGAVSRAALGRHVFANDGARHFLEGLVHPLIYADWRQLMLSAPRRHRVFDVPLLFEQGLENWFDFTVCVATSSAAQLARLENRGVPPEVAAARISKQLPLAHKIELADYVLSNDGSQAFLRSQIERLITLVS